LTRIYDNVDDCARRVVKALAGKVMLGLPLGIGKPPQFVNALYAMAAKDPGIELSIFTALTLELPEPKGDLERRFLEPLRERLFCDCPTLDYARDRRLGRLPKNVSVQEFYFMPGAMLQNDAAQRDHVNVNYTHVVRSLMARGVNVVAQLVGVSATEESTSYSLSSNPDVTLDLIDAMQEADRKCLLVGQVNRQLPFMVNDAEVPESYFDFVIDHPDLDFPLFPVLNRPVRLADYAAGLHAASLVADDGTLQIGIGSMGDAFAHALSLRQQENGRYRELLADLITPAHRALRESITVETGRFERGLYGASEIFTQAFSVLRERGVLTREVHGGAANQGDVKPARRFLECAFFLGPNALYRWLREQPATEIAGINMTRVSRVNQLYGNEKERAAERRNARFVNEAMMVTLTGAVVSDGIEDARVVSGVGGQYNFVAMAHALPQGRAIIVLPATRQHAGKLDSNIVWQYSYTTLPRHLRDIVVTEYGAADLRGLSDRDTIASMLCIADARFQDKLLSEAKRAGKIERSYRVPAEFQGNLPETIMDRLSRGDRLALFPHFPFGTDLSDEEARLAVALAYLKRNAGSPGATLRLLLSAHQPGRPFNAELDRMSLADARGIRERIYRRLLRSALAQTASARP
jgi:acyl-CoA hydrolase